MEVLIFLYGIIIGSFLNVCIYRIPRGKSIVFSRSYCTSCNYKLSWRELIPILSYVLLNGKCKCCKYSISIIYPIVELAMGLLYLYFYMMFGFSVEFFKICFLISIFIIIAIIDFQTKFIYTSTTLLCAIGGIVFICINYFNNNIGFIDNIIGAIIGGSVIGIISIITKAMGEGDIEVAALSGLFLGVEKILIVLFFSFLIGGGMGTFLLINKHKSRKSEIAFAPFLVTATLIAIVFGEKIIKIYNF